MRTTVSVTPDFGCQTFTTRMESVSLLNRMRLLRHGNGQSISHGLRKCGLESSTGTRPLRRFGFAVSCSFVATSAIS